MRGLPIRAALTVIFAAVMIVTGGCVPEKPEPSSGTPEAARTDELAPTSPVTESNAQPTLVQTPSGTLSGLVYADGEGLHILRDDSTRELINWSALHAYPEAAALSPTDARLTYSQTRQDLWVLDMASGQSRPLLSKPIRRENAYILRVKWSPDSAWLALLVGVFHVDGRPAPGLATLFTMEVSSGHIVELDSGVTDFSWLSSGERLVFHVYSGAETHGLFLAQADGTDKQILPFDSLGSVAVSPRDELFAVADSTLYVFRLDGSKEDLLRDYQGPAELKSVTDPSWSPGGTRIAFFSCERLVSDPDVCASTLFVTNLETRSVDKIAGNVQPPLAWSPDGRSIAVRQGLSVCRVSLNEKALECFQVPHLSDWPFEWR